MGLNNRIKEAFKISFESRCFQLIVAAYNSAISENSVSADWDENDITAQLHKYIENNSLRVKWSIISNVEHHLPKDSIKMEKGFSAKYPRIDLRFVTIRSQAEYKYFFEAKKLKETDSKLKRRYISTGIDNYISNKYEKGCLIGYLVNGNLDQVIEGVNSLLKKDQREDEYLQKKIFKLHNCYFESFHPNIGILKHMVFDFTK